MDANSRDHCASWRWTTHVRRPDCVTCETDEDTWKHLKSRWRYLHGLLFFVGKPVYILRRVAPLLLFNVALAVFVVVDHGLGLNYAYHVQLEKTKGIPVPSEYVWRSVLPTIANSNASILSTYSMLLASVSFMITWHLGKSTERWWEARKAMQVAMQCAQRGVEAAAANDQPAEKIDALIAWTTTWLRSLRVLMLPTPGGPPQFEMVTPAQAGVLRSAAAPHRLAHVKVAQLLQGLAEAPELVGKAHDAVDTLVMMSRQCLPLAVSILATGYCEFFLLMYAFAPTIAPPNEEMLGYLDADDGTHFKAHKTIIVTCVMWIVQYAALNLLLLGSDEVAAQLEHPFRMLPVDALIAKTERNMRLAPTLVSSLFQESDADGARLGVPPGVTKLSSRRSSIVAPQSPWTISAAGLAPTRDVEAGARRSPTMAGRGGGDATPLRTGRLSHV